MKRGTVARPISQHGRGVARRSVLVGLAGTTALLRPASAGLVELIATAKPSICAVGTFSALDSPRFTFRGSGFVVGDGNTVITCWHVLPEPSSSVNTGPPSIVVQVMGRQGRLETREADVVRTDRIHDLALLRIRGAPCQPLTLSSPEAIREGMDVALLGFPIGGVLGYKVVTHRGIVASIVASALPTLGARQLTEGAVARLREGSFELLQLDATAYPGNSGGPLLDAATGAVIGVVNMVLVKNNRESALSQPTGITYAVPVSYLAELLPAR